MEMYCPECMSPLVSGDGQTAVCPTHGGSYQILFARHPLAAPVVAGAAMSGAAGAPPPLAMAGAPGLTGVQCARHPEVTAVAQCINCRSPVCQTCDFLFPGGVHLCPTCAANPRPQLSPGRKKLIPWSIGLAVLSIVGLAGMVVLVRIIPHVDAQAIGAAGEFVSLLPAIVGLALGVASFDRRLRTPGVVWVGVIGNGVVLLIWLLLIIVGISK